MEQELQKISTARSTFDQIGDIDVELGNTSAATTMLTATFGPWLQAAIAEHSGLRSQPESDGSNGDEPDRQGGLTADQLRQTKGPHPSTNDHEQHAETVITATAYSQVLIRYSKS